jgi:hypothetical protein
MTYFKNPHELNDFFRARVGSIKNHRLEATIKHPEIRNKG